MSALLVDPITGDLVLTNNTLTLIDGEVQVQQNVAQRLRSQFGEWFLNLQEGIPYFTSVLVKNPVNAEALLKQAIQQTPGMIQLNSFSLTLNNATRVATVIWSGLCTNGPISGQTQINTNPGA